MRLGDRVDTRRRNSGLGRVWRLSKFTTQSLGTPSAMTVSSSSETRSRFVRVNAATTTDWMRSATGSLVRTNTGRSPPGVAANQISPRCISPVRPVLSRTPVCNVGKDLLRGGRRQLVPCLGVVLARQPHQVPVEGISEELGAVHAQLLRPSLGLRGFALADPKTDHRHTNRVSCMTLWEPGSAPSGAPAPVGTSPRPRSAKSLVRELIEYSDTTGARPQPVEGAGRIDEHQEPRPSPHGLWVQEARAPDRPGAARSGRILPAAAGASSGVIDPRMGQESQK